MCREGYTYIVCIQQPPAEGADARSIPRAPPSVEAAGAGAQPGSGRPRASARDAREARGRLGVAVAVGDGGALALSVTVLFSSRIRSRVSRLGSLSRGPLSCLLAPGFLALQSASLSTH